MLRGVCHVSSCFSFSFNSGVIRACQGRVSTAQVLQPRLHSIVCSLNQQQEQRRRIHAHSTAAMSKQESSSGSDADWKAFVSPPATGNTDIPPFHHAFPVHDVNVAREFYGGVLGLEEGRSADDWVDYNFFGHQIVAHRSDSLPKDHFNPVDGHDVPVPHFGAVLSWEGFDRLAERLKQHNVKFIIEPHVRFPGLAGEQKTMFFKDPSGNNLEFKAMRNPTYLFQKQ
ncbi:glyoxalase/bleomycin resistance protein/dioxygenase [Salpingoeca rosetta]|uniref:Glyoxalase/bleomycin resistance protein/dioxygenase n=1 Tax=Salpingoeca rosetta (strain ATCC 50818 / BSB-021) TaxID=946362 RepID=F2U941_SALR5|nr:glyoxalase/bleomycin resistance protein/dioxygenase [Salpingoeca rosetta]EGD73244.1 glyoxalase/bleomycin resistance protein/dioxygenase [Salpingoeca rosetta]|eukprot:XP_004994275.1 glyoxalase/bleomycin resistance protein/dioxygenase [Salpingoeca rosetta]